MKSFLSFRIGREAYLRADGICICVLGCGALFINGERGWKFVFVCEWLRWRADIDWRGCEVDWNFRGPAD